MIDWTQEIKVTSKVSMNLSQEDGLTVKKIFFMKEALEVQCSELHYKYNTVQCHALK